MIVPAVIPQSREHLDHSLDAVSGFAREVQVDIVDGNFVPFMSWPMRAGEWDEVDTLISEGGMGDEQLLEIDLMILHPEETLTEWMALGFTRFVIHVESTHKIPDIIRQLKSEEKVVGLSLDNGTELAEIEPYIGDIDFVQCMGIAEIGKQGNPFDERVLNRVTILKEQYPELEVSVDGSVNIDTIGRLNDVGVDRFISGSAIYGVSDPETAYRELAKRIA